MKRVLIFLVSFFSITFSDISTIVDELFENAGNPETLFLSYEKWDHSFGIDISPLMEALKQEAKSKGKKLTYKSIQENPNVSLYKILKGSNNSTIGTQSFKNISNWVLGVSFTKIPKGSTLTLNIVLINRARINNGPEEINYKTVTANDVTKYGYLEDLFENFNDPKERIKLDFYQRTVEKLNKNVFNNADTQIANALLSSSHGINFSIEGGALMTAKHIIWLKEILQNRYSLREDNTSPNVFSFDRHGTLTIRTSKTGSQTATVSEVVIPVKISEEIVNEVQNKPKKVLQGFTNGKNETTFIEENVVDRDEKLIYATIEEFFNTKYPNTLNTLNDNSKAYDRVKSYFSPKSKILYGNYNPTKDIATYKWISATKWLDGLKKKLTHGRTFDIKTTPLTIIRSNASSGTEKIYTAIVYQQWNTINYDKTVAYSDNGFLVVLVRKNTITKKIDPIQIKARLWFCDYRGDLTGPDGVVYRSRKDRITDDLHKYLLQDTAKHLAGLYGEDKVIITKWIQKQADIVNNRVLNLKFN